MSFSELDRAQILAEALPYIQKFSGKTIKARKTSNPAETAVMPVVCVSSAGFSAGGILRF